MPLADKAIVTALKEFAGNKTRAAEFLGVPRTTFRNALNRAVSRGSVPGVASEPSAGVNKVGARWEENGNEAVGVISDPGPKTLEDLIEALHADMDVWRVERWIGNKWPIGAKIDNQIIQQPLYQIKAWFVRKVAVATEFPVVAPISINISTPKISKTPKMRNMRVEVVFPDPHFGFLKNQRTGVLTPFHDRLAIDVALQLISIVKPDGITGLGDTLDCPEFSDKFVKSPEFHSTFQPSLIEAAWVLGRAAFLAPSSHRKLLEGNHDKRIETSIRTHLMAACDIRPANAPPDAPPAFSVPNLLGLKDIGWEYVGPYPDGVVWYNENLAAIHGDIARGSSGATVNSIIKETRSSLICGHIHRNEQVSVTRHGPSGPVTYTVVSCGTLARIDGTVPAHRARNNWQQGCAVVFYEDGGENYFHIVPVPINNGRAIWMGDVIEGRDYADALSRDTGWNFGGLQT